MAKYKAFDNVVEVNAETILSVVDGMGSFKAMGSQILEKNGITSLEPGKWYPQKSWLSAFQDISKQVGPMTLFTIGKKIPENAKFPPNVTDVHSALAVIDVAYHMNHRNGEIGHYVYGKTGERSAVVTTQTPYPSDFDRGLIDARAE